MSHVEMNADADDERRRAAAADTGERHSLRICRTCPRYERLPPPGQKTDGLLFVEAVRALADAWSLAAHFTILGVHCLGGCPAPCNAVLAASGKASLRFHRLSLADAPSIVEVAALYYRASGGECSLPPALRARLAAVIRPLTGTPWAAE
jgi:predicted metal-binding protein